jgi:hypothetical protein
VVDLLDVLDTAQDQPAAEFDLLTRLRTPGAMELLDAYDHLRPDIRVHLINLVRSLAAPGPLEASA